MDIVVGSPATGENFYGREHELEMLWSRIRNNSVLLASPRRFGKTSLVKQMQRAPRDGFEVVYVDAEGVKSPQRLIALIAEALSEPVQHTVFRRLVDSIKGNVKEVGVGHMRVKLRKSIEDEWKRSGEELCRALQNSTKKHIIVIDEIPTFLESLEAAKDGVATVSIFLKWLRQMRQMYDIRFICCGSIGIGGILRRHMLSYTINDLERIRVSPFDRATATGMINQILDARHIQYEPDHVELILSRVGTPSPPFFVQIMLQEIDNRMSGNNVLSTEIVEESYKSILGENGGEYFEWYYERLRVEFPEEPLLNGVLKILDHLSEHEPCTRAELMQVFALGDRETFLDAMQTLESQFYVTRDDEYSFYVKMFRDWWTRRRVE